MVKCEACNGNGYHWYAYNIETDEETECTEDAWYCLPEDEWCDLPETEETTEAKYRHYIRGAKETCEVCDGTGEVEYEEDYDD